MFVNRVLTQRQPHEPHHQHHHQHQHHQQSQQLQQLQHPKNSFMIDDILQQEPSCKTEKLSNSGEQPEVKRSNNSRSPLPVTPAFARDILDEQDSTRTEVSKTKFETESKPVSSRHPRIDIEFEQPEPIPHTDIGVRYSISTDTSPLDVPACFPRPTPIHTSALQLASLPTLSSHGLNKSSPYMFESNPHQLFASYIQSSNPLGGYFHSPLNLPMPGFPRPSDIRCFDRQPSGYFPNCESAIILNYCCLFIIV